MSFDTLLVNQIAQTYVLLGAATATLTRTVKGAQDPVSGAPATSSTLTCNTRCKLDATSLKTLGYKFGDGLVQSGDIDISIPAKGLLFEPLPGDTILARSIPFTVMSVRPSYAPGSTPVEFSLLARK